jgi:hypothetical protein
LPAVLAEITIDNSKGATSRRAFFGFAGNDAYSAMRRLDATSNGNFVGIGQGLNTAIASKSAGVVSGQGFTIEHVLAPEVEENHVFGLGPAAALHFDVAPGETKTAQFAICFHRDGVATAGMKTKYFYTRYFQDIEAVATFALQSFDRLKQAAVQSNALVENTKLSSDQKWMLAHAIRSYYGSTELLEKDGEPVWVVNEGEYRMMNTFDLTADHLYFELKMNPWVMRNALDQFVERYSYDDDKGISFTHDMGVGNVWSRPQYSSYELFGLDDCFSHMTHEQLVNWVLCAASYAESSRDNEWKQKRLPIFKQCLRSLIARDDDDVNKRIGIMQHDSSRCHTATRRGAEITTYDSLDVSLGQARKNLYMAVKTWAAYVALEKIFGDENAPLQAEDAGTQAMRAATTIAAQMTSEDYIPAVFENNNTSRIIPAIEGLAFPLFTGCGQALQSDGRYSNLLQALNQHLENVLVPGVCKFESGAWKLSSTSENSWLSKTYLCQFVARKILGFESDPQADAAHVAWLQDPKNAYFAWSDQIVSGVAKGSKYYPRGVTAILWLDE